MPALAGTTYCPVPATNSHLEVCRSFPLLCSAAANLSPPERARSKTERDHLPVLGALVVDEGDGVAIGDDRSLELWLKTERP